MLFLDCKEWECSADNVKVTIMEAATVTQLITAVAALAGVVLMTANMVLERRRVRETRETQDREYEQRDRAADASERDAEQRHITELYTMATDQLKSDKAPVRLMGLRALERLAVNTPEWRQTVVDVICAYLRMPWTPPEDSLPAEAHVSHEDRCMQEVQIRLSAQEMLAAHLSPGAVDSFWPDIDLNLSGARLYQLRLFSCRIRVAKFDGAEFSGYAVFAGTEFRGDASFVGAKFSGGFAVFPGVRFVRYALFDNAEFTTYANFMGAKFAECAKFAPMKFAEDGRFCRAPYPGGALFGRVKFSEDACFVAAKFYEDAWFYEVEFSGDALFDRATFSGEAGFDGATFAKDAKFDRAQARPCLQQRWPAEWTARHARTAEDEDDGWLYLVRVDGSDEPERNRDDRSGSEAETSKT
ncbi:MAG: pentapeptide repeat-containing protein [Pseudonocardiaceae bacterium]